MRPCPAGRGGDGTALVIPCHVAFAGRQRGADLSKSRATPPPKRGSKKIWGQLWGHVIFSIMKKSFIFSMLLAYFVFPRSKPLDSLRHGNASQAVFLCPFLAFGCAYALSVKLLVPDKLWTAAPRESVCCKKSAAVRKGAGILRRECPLRRGQRVCRRDDLPPVSSLSVSEKLRQCL